MPPLFDPAVQPRVDAILGALDVALVGAGGVAAIIWVICLIRSGRIRQPLADVPLSGGGPDLLHLLLVMAVYFAVQIVGSGLLLPDGEEARLQLQVLGSNAYHVGATINFAAKLAGCGVIILILARTSAFAPAPVRFVARRRSSWLLRTAVVVALATASTCSVTWLLAAMGDVIWRWLYPDTPPPMHEVLLAFRNSAWGVWGVVQLFFGAIVVAPIAEEFFFRGLVLETVTRYTRSAWIGIAASAVAFGFVHAQPQAQLALISMGLILGYVRVRWGGLERCMLIHALFNARTIAVAILAPHLLEAA